MHDDKYMCPPGVIENDKLIELSMYHIPSNISTVIDLLEDKKISWATYQESMPTDGFYGIRCVFVVPFPALQLQQSSDFQLLCAELRQRLRRSVSLLPTQTQPVHHLRLHLAGGCAFNLCGISDSLGRILRASGAFAPSMISPTTS